MMRGLAGWLTIGAALTSALAGCGSSGPAVPAASPTPDAAQECPRYGDQARDVSLGVDGSHNQQGLVVGTGPVGIILAHQVDTTLCEWTAVAVKLAARGHRVLAFDFNGFGVSATSDAFIDKDVAAATAFLRTGGATSIVLIGASMGGTAVVVAAADIRPPVAAVVNISGSSSFGNVSVNGVKAVPRLTMPVLYEASQDDNEAAISAQNLYDSTPAGNRTIELIPGSAHGVRLLTPGGSLAGWPALDAFLAAHTPPTPATPAASTP
jgi:dienelactone hydrolase/predicted small lipoprotein YifL